MRTSKLLASAALCVLAANTSGCERTSNNNDPNASGGASLPAQCGALKVTGVSPGQVAPGITLRDGDGKPVNTHQFCDKTVLLIAGSMF